MFEAFNTLELIVPRPLRLVVGAAVGTIMLTAFVLFFVWLAIYDLSNSSAFIPAILWLGLVAAIIFGIFKEWGLRKFLIEIVSIFASREFLWTVARDETRKELHFGYEIFGHRFSYWKIPTDKITRVNWSTGQATHIAGRDMDDWSVVVWYQHDDPAKALRQRSFKNPDQELYIVGLAGKKEDTAAFGRCVMEFLGKSGVSLIPGKDECSFQREPVAPEKV